MAEQPPPAPLQIQFVLVSSSSAPRAPPDAMRRSISPLMTVGYLRRQAWSCVHALLPPAANGIELGYNCLRLVSAGIVLSDDMKLLREFLKPPPATNSVFVALKPPEQPRHLQPVRALATSSATSAATDAVMHSNADGQDPSGIGSAAEDEYFCRICHGDGPAADFIQPCVCSGSMRHVHAACLSRWRSVATNALARTQCEQCHHPYRLTQAWWVPLILAPTLIFALNIIAISLAVSASGILLLPCAHYFLSLLLLPPDTAYQWLSSGVFGLGIVSFCHLVYKRFSWMLFRGGVLHINWHSLLMTLLPLIALQEMTFRVVVALGVLHALSHGYNELRSFTMRYCSAHGERILNV